MWRGRYQLGQDAILGLLTTDANGTPVWPDLCPQAKVWDASGALTWSGQLPVLDRYGTTGFFQYNLFLQAPFAAGLYRVDYTYAVSGTPYLAAGELEVVAGGNGLGAVQSLHWYHQPHGEFLVQQLSSGGVQRGRNPRV